MTRNIPDKENVLNELLSITSSTLQHIHPKKILLHKFINENLSWNKIMQNVKQPELAESHADSYLSTKYPFETSSYCFLMNYHFGRY